MAGASATVAPTIKLAPFYMANGRNQFEAIATVRARGFKLHQFDFAAVAGDIWDIASVEVSLSVAFERGSDLHGRESFLLLLLASGAMPDLDEGKSPWGYGG